MSGNTISGSSFAAGATCSSCGTTEDWGGSSWCPVCGYYPALNRAVPNAHTTAVQGGNEDEETNGLPIWALVALIGVGAILATAFVLRIVVPDGPRGFVAMGMTALGFVTFVIAHGMAVATALKGAATFSPFDVVVKPVEIWRYTFLEIDKGYRKVWFATWGLVCGFSGLLIVGGIDYDLLFKDLGKQKREKSNVMKQLFETEDATESTPPPEDTMFREAMEESTGQPQDNAALDESSNEEQDGEGESNTEDDPDAEGEELEDSKSDGSLTGMPDGKLAIDYLPTVDCAVMGYCTRSDGSIRCLILAGVVNGELRCLGQCSVESLDELTRQNMARVLEPTARSTPFIHTFYDATWVQPKVRVRVAFTTLIEGKRLKAARVKEILPTVDATKSETTSPKSSN